MNGNRNRIARKAAVVGLSVALAAGQAVPMAALAAEEGELSKEESVFVNLDASGQTRQIIVSEWLKNVAVSAALNDATALESIANIKGEETFAQNGESVVWDAQGSDIYYQGTTSKDLPVTMEVTYRLDGSEVAPADLVGKSGAFEMTIEYANHEKDGDVYVPFAALTGMIFPTDKFKNVEIDNGKLLSDADKVIAVGMAFPGLQESLDLSEDLAEDIQIPSSVTVTADVTDFELGNTLTVVTANLLDGLEVNGVETDGDLMNSMDELKDASKKLVDGSEELADGVGTLKEKSGEFSDGVDTLTDGLNQLDDGAGTLNAGIKTYTDGANSLAAGITKLNQAVKALPEKLKALVKGVGDAKSGADALVENTGKLSSGMSSVDKGIDTVHDAIAQIQAGMGGMTGALTQSAEAIGKSIAADKALLESLQATAQSLPEAQQKALQQEIAALQTNIATQSAILEQMTSSDQSKQLSQLTGALDTLAKTTGKGGELKSGAQAVDDGLKQLLKGQKSLQSGLAQIKEGVDQLGGDSSEVSSLSSAVGQLNDGAKKLSGNSAALVSGSQEIVSATSQLAEGGATLGEGTQALIEGIDKLSDGSIELKDGMAKFDKDGIQKLYNTVNGDLDKMLDQLEKVVDAGQGYKSYAGIADGMDGSVKFILETDAIEAEEE